MWRAVSGAVGNPRRGLVLVGDGRGLAPRREHPRPDPRRERPRPGVHREHPQPGARPGIPPTPGTL